MGVKSYSDWDGESHVRPAEHFYQNPKVFALTTSFPFYETLCLALLHSFVPGSYSPNIPERLSCSVLCSVAVPVQAFQHEGRVCSQMPESLCLFLPLCTAQRHNERSVILCGIRELWAGVKQHNQLALQLLFCTLLRERRRKWGEVEPVLCQCRDMMTLWGCVNAAHKGATAEQDIPSLVWSLLMLAVLFWHNGAG